MNEEGGSFSKRGEADEAAYFHRLQREQLQKMKEQPETPTPQGEQEAKKKDDSKQD